MINRQEVKVQARGPDGGNPTPKRQGRWLGAPGPTDSGSRGQTERPPVRGRLVEVIGARPYRTKVKRRKAAWVGELADSSEAQYPLVVQVVLATRWSRSLLALPEAFCRGPRER